MALIVPRLVRMAWPQVWIEDESYLNCAFMLATGHAPYTSFPMPHFPLLEGLLALVMQVFPASIRTAETLTQIAAFAASVAVWRLGRTLGGRVCGVAAALIVATSPLLFRYHVFEREVYLIVPVLAAAWLALRPELVDRRAADRRALLMGLLLALAMAVKLTAVAYVGAFFLYLWIERRRRDAIVTAAAAAALVGVTAAALWATFGMPFMAQVVLFRLLHASFHTVGGQFQEFLHSLDVEFAFGLVGLALIVWTGRLRAWLLPLLNLACGIVLLVVLNSTFWAHDSIELLPWFALFGGALVADVAAAWRRRPAAGGARRVTRALAAVAVAAAIGLLAFVTPIDHPGWGPGAWSGYGLGYRDRTEIDRIAAFIRARTTPAQRVAVPPIIAFEANRPELVVYPELAGTMMEIERDVTKRGVWWTLRRSGIGRDVFWNEVASSREVWQPRLLAAIRQHRIGAVVDSSPADLFPVPLIDVPDAALREAGYAPTLTTQHYTVWTIGSGDTGR